ncbi:MAG: adenylate/guanylate cyclase domain-containing protein [Actinomycetota bacterium]
MICERCGTENPDSARFCQSCAGPLTDASDEAVRSRKIVTFVFTDVVGSTSLGERLDPELLRQVMTNYFERMGAVLERHGGNVEKYIGDAIVAVFGIPELREDDALRGVRAASEMRTALDELNRELEDRHGVRIEARTGVNTGEVLAEETRPDAPLTSDAGNLAARLEQAAASGEILIGDSTYRLVRDAVQVESAGPFELKGKAAPQAAWRLIEVSAEGPGIARRLDSPIVGRNRELSLLREAFEHSTGEASCRLVTVIGTPGVGKSRLSAEFITWLRGRATILQGRCLPYGDGITYWPVAEVVREAAAITEQDAPDDAMDKIASLCGEHEETATIAERLASVLGLTETTAPAQETFWAVRRLLEAMAGREPLAVVFDDIHWGEATFLDLVEYLAGWSTGAPILLLCLARPDLMDTRPMWGAGVTDAASIRLDPLTEEDSERLIGNLLGPAPLDEEVGTRIRQAAEGNPLFVEEILRMLVDDGLLRRDDGRWTAAGDLSAIAIPPTINALLSARLERLPREERAVIQRASVVGKVFWWGAVAELSPAPEQAAVGGHLQALVRKELVRPDRSRFSGEDAFRFSHILIRDAAYAGTTKELRAELHERFAGWIERRAADHLTEFEEILGYHLEQAHRYRTELGMDGEVIPQLAARSAKHLASAGTRALKRVDIQAAINLLSRATALMEEGDPDRVELLVDLVEALTESGQMDRAREVIEEASREAEALGDERLAAHVVMGRWYIRANEGPGEFEHAERDGLQASEVFAHHGDDRGLARAWHLVGVARWWAGRAGDSEEALERARQHARAAGDPRREAESLLTLSAVLAQGPRHVDDAASRAEAFLEEYAGDRTIEAYMSHALGHLRAWQGRIDEARTLARRYRDILRENGQEANWADSSECEGDVLLMAGDVEGAIRLMEEGQRRYEELNITDTTILPFLANALVTAGRWEEAEAPALRSIEGGHPLWRTLGMTTLGRIRARQSKGEEAERLAREALDAARASDYPLWKGRAALGLAEILEVLGRNGEVTSLREYALREFEQKGAKVWADQARSLLEPKRRDP